MFYIYMYYMYNSNNSFTIQNNLVMVNNNKESYRDVVIKKLAIIKFSW